MNFDFYQQYKDYSNIDLLKIIKRPDDYQPAAVTVATQLLSERQVTSEEVHLIDKYFQEIDNSAKDKSEKIDKVKTKVSDFLEPVLQPSKKVEPDKWINILLLVIALQYLWSLFQIAKHVISFLQCDFCSIDITLIAALLTSIYVPLIFYLLFKRRRWGWILLFADNLFSVVSRVSQSYLFFKYQSIHHGDITSFLLPILVKTAFVFFLWRDSIANHFRVSDATKKKTALVTIGGTLFFIVAMFLLP